MFSPALKAQAGIIKQNTNIGPTSYHENDLVALTGYYDKIHNKGGGKIIIVEVVAGTLITFVDINIFKNAPSLKRLIP